MYAIRHVISAMPKDFIIEFKFFSGLKYNIPVHNSNKLAGQKPKANKQTRYKNNIIVLAIIIFLM